MADRRSWNFARPVEHIVWRERVVGTRYRIDDGERCLDVYDVWLPPWQQWGVSYARIEEQAD